MNISTVKIFIVDDDLACLTRLARCIHAAGWPVMPAETPEAFLESASRHHIGCVVMELGLHGVGEFELLERMTEAGISLPVIFVSHSRDVRTVVQAMKLGAVDFLTKPVDEAALLNAIEQAIQRHELQSQRHHAQDFVLERFSLLSGREREVLSLLLQGLLNKQIGYEMGITLTTVKKHRASMMRKLQVRSVVELAHLRQIADFAETIGKVRTPDDGSRRLQPDAILNIRPLKLDVCQAE